MLSPYAPFFVCSRGRKGYITQKEDDYETYVILLLRCWTNGTRTHNDRTKTCSVTITPWSNT